MPTTVPPSFRRLFFIAPDTVSPQGGIKKIYNHVDILRSRGFNAYVLHLQYGFRCRWFDNQTPIAYSQNRLIGVSNDEGGSQNGDSASKWSVFAKVLNEKLLTFDHQIVVDIGRISPRDIIVVPEVLVPYLQECLLDRPHVVYNQGCYLTFYYDSIPSEPFLFGEVQSRLESYYCKSHLASLVVSNDSRDYLKHIYPNLPVLRLNNSINAELFAFSERKMRQMCFHPKFFNDEDNDCKAVLRSLKHGERMGGWRCVPLKGLKESQVAEVMKESALFLSFSTKEGFGLPSLEAMSCGCIVIGYHGQGGREFICPPHAFPIEEGNILAFVNKVEEAARAIESGDLSMAKMGKLASDYVKNHYNQEAEEKKILEAWGWIGEAHSRYLRSAN